MTALALRPCYEFPRELEIHVVELALMVHLSDSLISEQRCSRILYLDLSLCFFIGISQYTKHLAIHLADI